MHKAGRMKKEMEILQKPPPGISCWPVNEDQLDNFGAQIVGGSGTPFEGGVFHLDIKIPDRYPFEPPKVQFTTPIYHPNVDTAGRICLDLLKMPPAGSWKPSWNLSTMLTSIQLLMADPNPDDPLMVEIANEYKTNKSEYQMKAKEWTQRYATQKTTHTKDAPKSTAETSDANSDQSKTCDTQDEIKENKRASPTESKNKLGLKRSGLSRKRTLQESTNTVKQLKK